MSERRVAVTGIGLVCALGLDRETAWRGLLEGRCGIGDLTLFAAAGYRSAKVAQVPPAFDEAASLSRRQRRRYSRSDRLAVRAAGEALEDSRLLDQADARAEIAVLLGGGTNDLLRGEAYYAELLTRGYRHARVSKVFNYFNDTPTDTVACHFGLTGPRACPVSACSSSAIAIGYAADLVRAGHARAAVCGGSDALCQLTLSGFNALRLVDTEACRPFDVSRAGMNIGEAGAVLVLEPLDEARARGAHVYAEMSGYAACCEAYHATAPEPEGLAVAALLEAALKAAGVSPSEVDHVNAHGTGTPQNDLAEAKGLCRVFGARAAQIPVTSTKSMVGHCLAAAGSVEAAILALTIDRGVIPPTIHHSQTDPACPIDVVANQARSVPVRCGVSTSLAFGGNDAALVMQRVE